ncbi:MAG TPA: hypothetical protein VGE07_26870 [Herpetosiphonaceae bacterium]
MAPSLRFSLETRELAYAAGDPVTVTVRLLNDSDQPVVVNQRLALNAAFAPLPFRDVAFLVRDSAGNQRDFQVRVRIGEPGDKDFGLLEPQQSITRDYDLAEFFDLGQPGEYAVEARYQNQARPGDGEAWQGELASNILRLAVR